MKPAAKNLLAFALLAIPVASMLSKCADRASEPRRIASASATNEDRAFRAAYSGFEAYISARAHDPSSLEIVGFTTPVDNGNGTTISRVSYRAKNGFGALVLTSSMVVFGPSGEVMSVENLP